MKMKMKYDITSRSLATMEKQMIPSIEVDTEHLKFSYVVAGQAERDNYSGEGFVRFLQSSTDTCHATQQSHPRTFTPRKGIYPKSRETCTSLFIAAWFRLKNREPARTPSAGGRYRCQMSLLGDRGEEGSPLTHTQSRDQDAIWECGAE